MCPFSISSFIFAALFSAGCVIGTLLACNADGSGEFFTDLEYSVRAAEPAQLGFFRFAAGEVLVYAVLLLLGFTVFGVAVIPAVSFAKGFSFSFTFAAFVRLFAGADAKWTVFLFVTDAIFMLPAFFAALRIYIRCSGLDS